MPWKPWQSFPRCARYISTSQPQIFLCLLKNITVLLTWPIYSSVRRVDTSDFSFSFSLPLSSKNKVLRFQELLFPDLASLCLGGVCSGWVLQRCLSRWNNIYRGLCAHQGCWVVWSPGWHESDCYTSISGIPKPSCCGNIESGQPLLLTVLPGLLTAHWDQWHLLISVVWFVRLAAPGQSVSLSPCYSWICSYSPPFWTLCTFWCFTVSFLEDFPCVSTFPHVG